MQHVRFALGGAHQFPPEWEDSPKAIQAVWGTHMSTPEQPGLPDWAALKFLFMTYSCIPPCTASYSTQSSLSKHQVKCKHATAADTSLDEALERRHARKRQKTATQHATVASSSSTTAQSSVCSWHCNVKSISFDQEVRAMPLKRPTTSRCLMLPPFQNRTCLHLTRRYG